jgi:nucleoside-diphosphate-sugar epimerase
MKTLVTGATGFIGSRLAHRLLDEGHETLLLGLKRNEVEAQYLAELEAKGARTVIGSVTEPESLVPAVDGVEVVYHLAAAQHEANVPDQLFHDVNVSGTRNMFSAAKAAGVRRIIHGSSIGVYGWIEGGTVRDDSPLDPDNIYGVTKLAGEAAVREFKDGPEWAIVRISEVYGPGDRRLIKMFRGAAKGRFPMIGRGDNLHHLIYIDDLLDGLINSAEHPSAVGQTFVLAGPRAYSSKEMLEIITATIDGPRPKIQLPLGPMLLAAKICEGTLRPLGIQPPLHPRRMNFYRKSFEFSMEQATDAIGYAPRVAFEEGAQRTADWYRQQRLL